MSHHSRRWGSVFAALILTLLLGACDTSDVSSIPNESVRSLMRSLQEMSTFSAIVEADSSLANRLDEDGSFTVLLPRDAAFEGIQRDTVVGDIGIRDLVSQHHIIEGMALYAGDITDGLTVTTMDGASIAFSTSDGLTVDGARIVTSDITASNGVIHVLDEAMLGRLNAMQRVVIQEDLLVLENAVDLAGPEIVGPLQGSGGSITLFAPTNDAFVANVDSSDDGSISEDELGLLDLNRVLATHIVSGTYPTSQIPTSPTELQTLSGDAIEAVRDPDTGEVTITLSDGTIASIERADITVQNGVVHTVDSLLVPRSR
ncbi:hypothetical protein CRI94_03210 [Longibacter salinarum]|uniref:FAS1 domain-containing protein n=1 Tax=Longibacter salinarum TaxID=1850348 RepID=A0A2A8D345_9BACT|nr:fasciclin domain-containing protein [Longibacter salinarum]PEN15301.1 hypothetical protein CRI94_03210 [Longibacter salinarum]